MAFIILCIDKKDPEFSELVPEDDTPGQHNAHLFPSRENADKWITEDEKEFPEQYDYHVFEV